MAGVAAASLGCRDAVTRPNTPVAGGDAAPQVIVHPAQDTTVDSIGTLDIDVAVHDRTVIDSVAVLLQGAPLGYSAFHPNDTTFEAVIQVPLAALHHQPFSYAVTAANILGRDTTTASINVRVR